MGFPFTLYKDHVGDKVTVYSFRIESSDRMEVESFWEKEQVAAAPDRDNLYSRLYYDVGDRWNFSHPDCTQGQGKAGWFRGESTKSPKNWDSPHVEALWAPIPLKDRKHLKSPFPSLRLYCFRLKNMLIVGNGGVKDVPRTQDSPELLSAQKDVKYVIDRVYERIEFERTLKVVDDGDLPDSLLKGDLQFDHPG